MNRFVALTAAAAVACAGAAMAQNQPKKDEKPATPPASKPADPKPAAPATPAAPAAVAKDIVDTAMGTGMHNTLATALKSAGLVETLKGKGPFTVFAPTDEAFKKLPAGTLDSLMKSENQAKLAQILKFHVISGEVMASTAMKMKESSKTLAGQTFMIETKDGKLMIGNDPKAMATVIKSDVKCSNGVIHVIDAVLMPKEMPAAPAAPAPAKPPEKK